MPKKWKYAKPKEKMTFEEYVQLPEDEPHKITIKNWIFQEKDIDGDKRTTLQADIVEFDGEPTSKIFVVKYYDNVQALKKVLMKKTSIKDTLSMEVTRKYDSDEMEYYYDMKFL